MWCVTVSALAFYDLYNIVHDNILFYIRNDMDPFPYTPIDILYNPTTQY